MKKLLSMVFSALLFAGCSKDDNSIDFSIKTEVEQVTDYSATVTWTRPAGTNIAFDVFLNNELIESDFLLTAYTFEGLSADSDYNGKIVASDGSQSASDNFSFRTKTTETKVFDGTAWLSTQEQVNEFGSHGYTEIVHHLKIEGSGIYDLSPLQRLRKVGKNVEIKYTSMPSLEGLHRLQFIGGKLDIYRCTLLDNLDGLSNLKTLNGDFHIYSSENLKNLDGLKNLEGFTKGVGIGSNPLITTVDIFQDATSLHHLSIVDNENLETVTGFQNVTEIEDYLDIWINPSLTSLTGTKNVTSIGGILDIDNNQNLTNLDLKNLESVGSDFSFWANEALTDLDGFNQLSSVGGEFLIINNTSLSDLCGITEAVLNQTENLLITGNLYNPTKEDFLNGNCSQ